MEPADIEFGELPQSHRGNRAASGRHVAIAAALRARPGEWALVAKNVGTTEAGNIKSAHRAAYRPAGSFEAVTRGNGKPNRADIWARYVGETTP